MGYRSCISREVLRSRSPVVRKGGEKRPKGKEEDDLPQTQDYSPPRAVQAQGPESKKESPNSKVSVSDSGEEARSSSSGDSSSEDTRVSPHGQEDHCKPWEFRRKSWMSFVGPSLLHPMVPRDFEQCPIIAPNEDRSSRERPQKNFIAVFIPQLTRTDISDSSVRGCQGVFYVKELTPMIIDNQGPLRARFFIPRR